MFEFIIWFVLSLAAWYLLLFVFSFAQAQSGLFFGAKVQRVSIGNAPTEALKVSWQGKHWDWEIGPLPFGSSTKFAGELDPLKENGEQQAQSRRSEGLFSSLSTIQKILILISGPIALLILSGLLLSASVFAGADQLSLSTKNESTIFPVAVSGLKIEDSESEVGEQFKLAWELIMNLFPRYFLFQSCEGWGGLAGCVSTLAAAGTYDWAAWVTCIGCLSFALAVVNLLPIPPMGGFQILHLLAASFFGQKRIEKTTVAVIALGLAYLLTIMCRIFIADFFWIVGTFSQ